MRRAVTGVLVAVALVVAGGLLIGAIGKVQETAARTRCVNNLRSAIAFTIHNYEDSTGQFPPAVKPNPRLPIERRFSWLAMLGPYIEATDLYVKTDWDKAWDAEENRYLAQTVLPLLQCPDYRDLTTESTLAPTHYIGIAGLGPDAAGLPPGDPRAGFFGYERKLGLPDVRACAGPLLVAVETSQAWGAWTAGGLPTVRGLDPEGLPYLGAGGQFGGNHPGGAMAVFADSSVRFLHESLDPRVFESMATVARSQEVDRVGD
jgi:hypothetical protein